MIKRRDVVKVSGLTGGSYLLKVQKVTQINGRQGVKGWVMDQSTGLDARDGQGKRVGSWAYVSQVESIERRG